MDELHEPLWRRIEAFELDDPAASLMFTQRLARENNWSPDFSQRVVDEYKRFVFLAMTAGHEVTPSDEIDQAWHLHLTYTRSYWDELCGKVLGRPLHHGPTKGGRSEGERFEDQYTRTFESYRRAFGHEPPADIWPPTDVRFGEAPHWVRVNKQRDWVIAKPWRSRRSTTLVAGIAGLGVAAPLAKADNEALGYWLLFGFIALALAANILKAIWKASHNGASKRRDSSGCSSGCGAFFGGWGDSGGDGGSGCGASGCGGCGGCGG